MDFPEWMADSYLFQRLHNLGNSALSKAAGDALG